MRKYSTEVMRGDVIIKPAIARSGGGLVPISAITLCVTGVLVWTLAAHDPYWRLFETSSLPAPAYESPGEIQAALASSSVVSPVPDSVAVRPQPHGGRAPGAALGEPALTPRPVEPLVAVPMALMTGAPAEKGPANIAAADRGANAAPMLAAASTSLAAPSPTPDAGIVIASTVPPAPVTVPDTPAPLWVAADKASENALALARRQRAEVQRRLALAGFNPRGFDGLFGPRTRKAIADFEEAWGFPSTGYLDAAVYADLRARTEDAYLALASRAVAEPSAAPKLAPVARERELAVNDSDSCARDGRGRIIARQSFGCDLKGLAEKVISMGRTVLPQEDGDVAVASASTEFAQTHGSGR